MVLSEGEQKPLADFLARLNIKPSDRILTISEQNLADSSFFIGERLKQIFTTRPNDKVCLVALHNTLGHYRHIGKKLGFDLMKMIEQEHSCIIIEAYNLLFGLDDDQWSTVDSEESDDLFSNFSESPVEKLSSIINEEMAKMGDLETWHLIIDDVSHLLDLEGSIPEILDLVQSFESRCRTLLLVLHESSNCDKFLSNIMAYYDVHIIISSLKTGISQDVTGVVEVRRKNSNMEMFTQNNTFHYKALDNEIRIFAPGESIYYLYK